jgi:subtilase family serine protease
MEKMILVLRPDDVQDQALRLLIRDQHDPNSPSHHRWLTPEMYAERFGISDNDVAVVSAWLQSHGMTIEQVSSGGRLLQFTGTAAQVEETFHTPIRAYTVAGELHYANTNDPEIPRALASVVFGVVSLHDFRSQPSIVRRDLSDSANTWSYNGIQQSALVPQDLVKIYDVSPLYTASLDGTGQSIAVIGRSNIAIANVRTFRTSFGLPANDPQIILNGKDPGIICGGDEAEAYLDVEWAGALAKKATVKFVVSASTTATDGIFLASQYAVNRNLAPIVSLSYGLCEKSLGTAGNQFFNSLWQQAATQGMSVFVASMDSGAAGCDEMNAARATGGLAINGLGSTPFNTAVGGTQFDDASNLVPYWSTTNDPTTPPRSATFPRWSGTRVPAACSPAAAGSARSTLSLPGSLVWGSWLTASVTFPIWRCPRQSRMPTRSTLTISLWAWAGPRRRHQCSPALWRWYCRRPANPRAWSTQSSMRLPTTRPTVVARRSSTISSRAATPCRELPATARVLATTWRPGWDRSMPPSL